MEKEVLFGTFDAFLIRRGIFAVRNLGTTGKNTERGVSYILEQNPGRTAGIISDPYAGGLASEASLCLRVNRFSALPFPLGAMWSRQISILRRERRSRHFRSMITQK